MAHCVFVECVVVPRIKQLPVYQIVASLKAPRKKAVVRDVPVLYRVARRKQSPTSCQVQAKEGVGFVHRVAINRLAAQNVAWVACTERGGERAHFASHRVGVRILSLVAESTEVEENTVLVEVTFVQELLRRTAPRLSRVRLDNMEIAKFGVDLITHAKLVVKLLSHRVLLVTESAA